MIEQEMDFPIAGRLDRLNDIGQNLAAIVATTRRNWISPGQAPPAHEETIADSSR